jgi:hypothetical protein
MSKVEVVIERGIYNRELLRFKRWLIGWMYDRYGASSIKVAEGDGFIVFEVDGDMFELFSELRIEMKLMMRNLKADVKAVGLCSGEECVVIDDFVKIVLPNYVIRRLDKMVNKIKHIIGNEEVEGIEVVNQNGMIVVYMEGCCAKLYVNEAFVVATDLVIFVEDISNLKILDGVRFVYDVFEPPEPRSLDIDLMTDENGIILFVDECSKLLTLDEALRVAYRLMQLSLNQLRMWKKEEEKEKSYELC